MNKYMETFIKYRYLLYDLVIRDIKIKYRRSVLGFLWSLLNPLLMMLVISAVFSTLFRFDIENFPIYLLTGQIIFGFFSEATNAAMTSVIGGASLIKKTYIPKYIFPLSKVLSAFVNLVFSLAAVILMLFITKTPVTWTIVLFPVPLLYVLVFAAGFGMLLSTVAVFFRDTLHLYGVLLTAWMYFTPIFYPAKLLLESPHGLGLVLKFNPLYYFIAIFRNIVLYGNVPSVGENLICAAFALGAFLLGTYVFYKNQDKYILYI